MLNLSNKYTFSNVYEYDISSCYYKILKSINYDMSNINIHDKIKRNIYIGNLQKENKFLSEFLIKETEKIINLYINKNNLKSEDIIYRMRDGFISKKKLTILNATLPLDYRGELLKLFFSYDNKKHIKFYLDGKIEVKGFVYKPYDNNTLKPLLSINYNTQQSLIDSLETIRQNLFITKEKTTFFLKKKDNIIVPIKNFGFLNVKQSFIKNININEIDRELIWKEIFWPFINAVITENKRN